MRGHHQRCACAFDPVEGVLLRVRTARAVRRSVPALGVNDDRSRADPEIRRLFYAEHWKIRTIATSLGLHPDTVRGAVESDRFNRPTLVRASTLTDPYLGFIGDARAVSGSARDEDPPQSKRQPTESRLRSRSS